MKCPISWVKSLHFILSQQQGWDVCHIRHRLCMGIHKTHLWTED